MRSILCIFDNIDMAVGLMYVIMLLPLAGAGLVNDIRSYKIPNKLNLTFIVLGFALNLFFGRLLSAVAGCIFPLILFPLFALRMLGAGDIKLFCAIGAIVGFPLIVEIMAYSIVINGIIALVIMVLNKNTDGFVRLWNYIKYIFISGKLMQYQNLNKENKSVFRYAYGIFGGCIYFILTDFVLGGRYALF